MSGSTIFSDLTADLIDPAIVIDASLPLELSGEAVRGRICLFSDGNGKEWAMRPDVTLPAALDEIERRRGGGKGARTVRYDAPVFRLPSVPDEPIEFNQIGFEHYGLEASPAIDAGVFASILNGCQKLGVTGGYLRFGDLSLFPAFVDALGLPGETSAGLKRAFRQEGGVRAYLQAESGAASGLAQRMANMDRSDVRAFVDDIFALTGIRPVGVRGEDDIVARLHERAKQAEQARVPADVQALIEAVLQIDATPEEALEQYRAIVLEAGLARLSPVLDALQVRLDGIAEVAGKLMESARFSTRFGRRFTYYDGFVFEIAASEALAEAGRPFAAGGRYDALLSDLSGGEIDATALGGIIMLHRMDGTKGSAS